MKKYYIFVFSFLFSCSPIFAEVGSETLEQAAVRHQIDGIKAQYEASKTKQEAFLEQAAADDAVFQAKRVAAKAQAINEVLNEQVQVERLVDNGG